MPINYLPDYPLRACTIFAFRYLFLYLSIFLSPSISSSLFIAITISTSDNISFSLTREMQVHKHEQNGPKKVGKYEDEGDGGIAKEYKWYFFLFCINLTDRNGLFWNLDKVEKILFECQTRTRFCKQKYLCKFMFRAL